MQITLSDQQEQAVKSFRQWFIDAAPQRSDYSQQELDDVQNPVRAPVFYLGGFAGSGKTSILPFIIESLGLSPQDVAYGAPTGKAAKVMSGKLKGFGLPVSASTIHSMIYIPNREMIASLLEDKEAITKQMTDAKAAAQVFSKEGNDAAVARQKEVISEKAEKVAEIDKKLKDLYKKNSGPSFSFNSNSQLKTKKLVVIDEASMVGQTMADDLKSVAVPILAIGDPGQLPPVGDTPGLCVGDPDFFLSEIHRQARDNPIIRLSQIVREGGLLKPSHSSGCGLVDIIRRRDDSATYDLDREAQVLVGTNRNRWKITKKLRTALGYVDNGPYEGEPLIVCRNSKRFPELVNGTFVECMETIDMEDGDAFFNLSVKVPETGNIITADVCQGLFEETFLRKPGAATCDKDDAYRAKIRYEHMDFGHAITVHKSQGSQWEDVIVHDESGVFRDAAEKWLYTAVTRAAHRLTVVV